MDASKYLNTRWCLRWGWRQSIFLVFIILALLLSSIHAIDIESNPYYATWMKSIHDRIQNTTLSQIFLPGTHEASSYNLSDVASPDEEPFVRELAKRYSKAYSIIAKPWGECQKLTTYQQLIRGSRFLDWRISYREGGEYDPLGKVDDFYSCHGLWANRLTDMLQEVVRFLDETEEEIVFIEISHFNEFTPERYAKMQQIILNTVGPYLLQNSDFPAVSEKNFFEQVTVGQVLQKGKRLLIFVEPFVEYHGKDTSNKNHLGPRRFSKKNGQFPAVDNSVTTIPPHPAFFKFDTLNIPWANKNDAAELMEELVRFLNNNTDPWNEKFGVQFLLTPQFKDFLLGIVLDFFPGYTVDSIEKLSNQANVHLDKFFSQTSKHDPTIYIIDRIESTSLVDHAIRINYRNCHDNPQLRDKSKFTSCAEFKEQGRCETTPGFMRENCPFTCGFCEQIYGLPGDSCDKGCKFPGSKCKLGMCLIPNPYPLNHFCGANYQCQTGYCNLYTNRCSKRMYNDICDNDADCESGNCHNQRCQGQMKWKIIGEKPFCKAYKEDCYRAGMEFVTDLKGDTSGECTEFKILGFTYSGRKMLCANTKLEYTSYQWLPCGSAPEDCHTHDSEFVYSGPCMQDSCCKKGDAVLCGRR